jgi:protein-S-isoprenylcysteine O-methyltransferase Ste14
VSEETSLKRKAGSALTAAVGWIAVALFVVIYAIELFPHHGRPATLKWIEESFGRGGLIALNIVIVVAFLALLPYRRETKDTWRSKGAFIAFVIALMTEMFGWPLFLFLVSPLVEVPSLAPMLFDAVGHWPARFGTLVSIFGILLIASGWTQIHGARGLVTSGIYRWMRHPQYTGIFLFTLGWILHWPSAVTLALWPVLVGAYVWLALFEERQARQEYGKEWDAYVARTRRFVPGLV